MSYKYPNPQPLPNPQFPPHPNPQIPPLPNPQSPQSPPQPNPQSHRSIEYIHVDSSYRSIYPTITYDELYNLPAHPLYFTNGSSKVIINLPNHTFQIDDKIVLSNISSKNVILQNILMVKKNSKFIRFFHTNHGLSLYGLYDNTAESDFVKIDYVDNLPTRFAESSNIPDNNIDYYVLASNSVQNIYAQFSGIKGCDKTQSLIGNIPCNYLNSRHKIYLVFIRDNGVFVHDPNSYLVMLEKKSSINYADNVSHIKSNRSDIATVSTNTTTVSTNTVYIRYHNLFGIPLNHLNSGLATNDVLNSKYPFLSIIDKTKNTITVDVQYNAIVDPNCDFYHQSDFIDQDINLNPNIGGGNSCYARKISTFIPGYPNPNTYTYKLDKVYKNVTQARIISSIFPNTVNTIDNNGNNKLYWRNLSDGNHIYQLSIPAGIYYPQQLSKAIEFEFSKTIRCQYMDNTNITSMYDPDGFNKYHTVLVDIDEITGIVTMSSFRELVNSNALSIPTNIIEFTTSVDLCSNFGINRQNPNLNPIVPHFINPFDPATDILYIYFTPNSHCLINSNFKYCYNNLYRYTHNVQPGPTIATATDTEQAILINFHRTKQMYPSDISKHEIKSINTTTLLIGTEYDHNTNTVLLPDHNLIIGTIIITDQFNDPRFLNEIFVYEIIAVTSNKSFVVKRYAHGEKYKFIYDSIIINFSTGKESHYWLDQLNSTEPEPNTLSFTQIVPKNSNQCNLIVHHPNHQLDIGSTIIISNSSSVNQVPASVINRTHFIKKIINEDSYLIDLGLFEHEPTHTQLTHTQLSHTHSMHTQLSHTQLSHTHLSHIQTASIKYPDSFQLLFESSDTIGKLLNFNRVGEKGSITPYAHYVSNICPYVNNYDLHASIPKRINFAKHNYFYICCPELSTVQNTGCVTDAVTMVYWQDNPTGISVNSFVPTTKVFDPPIPTMSELHVSIYHPDGLAVDFNGADHTFDIEIICG